MELIQNKYLKEKVNFTAKFYNKKIHFCRKLKYGNY